MISSLSRSDIVFQVQVMTAVKLEIFEPLRIDKRSKCKPNENSIVFSKNNGKIQADNRKFERRFFISLSIHWKAGAFDFQYSFKFEIMIK
jgi:hypothetical protein